MIQERGDPFIQFRELKRLGHIIVHPGLQTAKLFVHQGGGCYGDDGDRHLQLLPDIARCGITIHNRHLEIHKDQVIAFALLQKRDGFFSVHGQADLSPALSQHMVHQLLVDLVVFGHEESSAGEALAMKMIRQDSGNGCAGFGRAVIAIRQPEIKDASLVLPAVDRDVPAL